MLFGWPCPFPRGMRMNNKHARASVRRRHYCDTKNGSKRENDRQPQRSRRGASEERVVVRCTCGMAEWKLHPNVTQSSSGPAEVVATRSDESRARSARLLGVRTLLEACLAVVTLLLPDIRALRHTLLCMGGGDGRWWRPVVLKAINLNTLRDIHSVAFAVC